MSAVLHFSFVAVSTHITYAFCTEFLIRCCLHPYYNICLLYLILYSLLFPPIQPMHSLLSFQFMVLLNDSPLYGYQISLTSQLSFVANFSGKLVHMTGAVDL